MAILKNKIIVLSIIFFFGFFIWMGIHAVEEDSMDSIQTYGGILSTSAYQSFNQLNSELKEAGRIIFIGYDQIQFLDQEGMICRYQYIHQALWRNEHVVLTNLRSFHFEYRDHANMLLTESPRNVPLVRTIGYTFCMQVCEKDIFASQKIRIPFKNENGREVQSHHWAFIDTQ